MKLIQLNIWMGRLQSQITNFLDSENPDILCLQEAISFNKEDGGAFRTVENIQQHNKMPYLVNAPVFSFKLMEGVARFSNSIISTYPIKKSEIIFTHLEHKDNFDFNHDNGNVRNFIHSVFELGGKPYNVLTHHGYWIDKHKNGNQDTLEQMQALAQYLDTIEGPVILTGDFNLAPHSESLELINHRMINLSIAHNLKTTRTVLTHKTEVCDYIFVNDDIKVKSFHASDELVSDHKALILEFEI